MGSPSPERGGTLERVRAAYAAYARGDIEATLEAVHPEVELHTPFAATQGMVLRGHDGYRQWFRELDETWDEWRAEPVRYIQDGERVAVVAQFYARARASGVVFDQPLLMAWRFEDGLARRLDVYLHVNEGLQALGLERTRA
jgi:ketosteroid isomerase-like protein